MIKMLRYLTAGESHGKALSGIMDGVPAGLKIDFDFINAELKRRQSGYGRGGRMKIENDKAEFLSGVRGGVTTGSPIAVLIPNADYRNWEGAMSPETGDNSLKAVTAVRPGHADLPGALKYGFTDARNILERASARSTAVTVALGGVAKCFLKSLGVEIAGRVISAGAAADGNKYGFDDFKNADAETGCIDPRVSKEIKSLIDACALAGDTLGGAFELRARGVKPGLGSHTALDRRLDFKIFGNIGGLQGIKSVEIGAGKDYSRAYGTEIHDGIYSGPDGLYRKTNNAGGIEGGISNGGEISVTAVFKPIPTTMKGLDTVDIRTREAAVSAKERSDVTAVLAASVVAESLLALTLAGEVLTLTGGDSMADIVKRYQA